MLSLPEEIRYFLAETGTPETAIERRYSETRFTLLLNEIIRNIKPIDVREVKLWLRSFLACVDVPSSLVGLRKADLVIGKMLGEGFRSQGCAPFQAQAVYHALFTVLTTPPLKADEWFQKTPRQSESQLLTYHLAAFDPFAPHIPSGQSPYYLYRLWGFRIHLGLRKILSDSGLNDETKKAYGTSARFFFKLLCHLPNVPFAIALPLSDALFRTHLDTFVAEAIKRKNQLGWNNQTIKVHRQRLELLYANEVNAPHLRPTGIESLDNVTESFDGEPTSSKNSKASFGPTVVTLSTENDSDDRIPDPVFVELLHQQAHKTVSFSLPKISRKIEHRYILSQFSLWWDTPSLQRRDLIELYEAVGVLIGETPNYLGVSLYLLLLLFTGRPLRHAINARIGKSADLNARTIEASNDHVLFIDPKRGCLFFQHRMRSSFHDGATKTWRPTLFWVCIPVPDPLTYLFNQYVAWLKEHKLLRIDHPFFYFGRGEVQRQLTVRDVRSVLAKILPCGPEGITPGRISQSFVPLFSHGFGLDEISKRLISGRALGRAFAPISYTRFEWREMSERYNNCCLELHDYAKPQDSSEGWWTRTSKRPVNKPAIKWEAAGSPLVMQEGAYCALVRSLNKRIAETSRMPHPQPIDHHNAYTCYVYLLLLRLGIRPRNKPGYLRKEFQAGCGYLTVSDKNSGSHYEDRLIRLPPLVQHAVKQLVLGQERLRHYLFFMHGPNRANRIPEDLLFFLSPKGDPIPFTLARFDNFLDSRLGARVFVAVQRNVGRHSLRTMFWERSIPDDISGGWLGHLRVGRGPLEFHSSTLLGQALLLISNQVEEALRNAGFKKLTYFGFSTRS